MQALAFAGLMQALAKAVMMKKSKKQKFQLYSDF
jgi:hypothetical protein